MSKQRAITSIITTFIVLITLIGANFNAGLAATPGTLKWKYPIVGNFTSYPAIGTDGSVYLPINDASTGRLVALTPDGQLIWEFDIQGYPVNAPSVDSNGNIYFESNGIYALDSNKNVLWIAEPGIGMVGADGAGHISIGPDHTIYASIGGGSLHAFDPSIQNPKTPKWISYQGAQSPAITSSGEIYTIGAQYWPWYLYQLNPTDGSVLMHSLNPPWINSNLPIIGKDFIYISNSTGGNILAYNFDTTLAKQYDDPVSGRYGPPVIGADGTVYLISPLESNPPYYLKAFNPDLTEKWSLDLTQYSPRGVPAIGNDGNIYIASATYGLIVVNSTSKEVIWDARDIFVVGFVPVIGPDGTVYIEGYDTQDWFLFAINTFCTGPANSSWPMWGANAQHTHVANSVAGSFKLPDTGQTKCYQAVSPYAEIPCAGTGQDGAYTINPMSFTDNGNGTVTDNNTGLIWQQAEPGYMTWASALSYCEGLSLGGFSGWRLPSKKELITIVDYLIPYPGPTIKTAYFPNAYAAYSWSSTTYAGGPDDAWLVDFSDGGVYDIGSKGANCYVRCARGGQYPAQHLTNNGNGTVTDNATGLMWQQAEPGSMTWASALSYCEGLPLGGYSDWRLPNVKELESITDDTRYGPAIDTAFFPNAYTSNYWSSTTGAGSPVYAWVVLSAYGRVNSYIDKNYYNYVRCVRGGEGGPPATAINVPDFKGDQGFTSGNLNYYRFTLKESTSIGIISTGAMDLKGTLYQLQSNGELAFATDLDHTDHISHSFTDVINVTHLNFMIRPGNLVNYDSPWTEPCGGRNPITATQYRELSPGTYYLAVEPDDGVSSAGSYGILLLKKPTSSNDFFEGLSLLVNDGDISNDYLDIYFKALYPEIYDQIGHRSGSNWAGDTINFSGISWARQCKALANVYLMYVLGECRLQGDDLIYGNFSSTAPESVFRSGGTIIFNNAANPDFGNIADAQSGDVFIRKLTGFNHYGMYLNDDGYVIDENWRSDGRIRIGADTENLCSQKRPCIRYNEKRWKIGRPQ